MTQKKPITDNGVILYKDYEFLFNMLTNEELGETIRHIMKNTLNPTLNPSTNKNVNNVFNYIANRIVDYRNKNVFYSDSGKKGGNPNLLKTCTLNPTLNPTLKLSKDKISKDKISKEYSILEPIVEATTSPLGNDSKVDISKYFEEWYLTYPRHVKKKEALKIYSKVVKSILPSKLLESAKAYKAKCELDKTEQKYIQHPTTWLNQGCWDDEYQSKTKTNTSVLDFIKANKMGEY